MELRICRVAKGSLQWASYPALTCMPQALSIGLHCLLPITVEMGLHCSDASALVKR